jgi:4-hydroxy-4-methyl-2-oxoglutarate aldolase
MSHDFAQNCRDAAHFGTGPVSDAMELLGLPRSVITDWRYVSSEPSRAIVGPAYTLRQGAKGAHVPHDENLTRQREASSKLAQPGDVIVIDVNGRTDVCTWGENQAMAAHSRGVAGLVAYGAVRDSEGIRRTGFPVLCRGFSPVTSRWDLVTVAMNEPVTIAGVQINPGDVIYGDADGVLVIPRDRAIEVFDKAASVHGGEEKRRSELYGSR